MLRVSQTNTEFHVYLLKLELFYCFWGKLVSASTSSYTHRSECMHSESYMRAMETFAYAVNVFK